MNVRYYMLAPKAERTHIRLECHLHGKRLRYRLPVTVNPKQWDVKRQRPHKGKAGETKAVKALLDKWAGALPAWSALKLAEGVEVTPDTLRSYLDTLTNRPSAKKEKQLTAIRWIENYIDSNPEYSKGTKKSHHQTLNHLKAYAPKFKWTDVNDGWRSKWLTYMYALPKPLSANTAGGHIKTLKRWMRAALNAKQHTNTSYAESEFTRPKASTDKLSLTEDNLKALQAVNLDTHLGLDRIRDMFLIACYTGLRRSEYPRLNKSNLVTLSNGPAFSIPQPKTGKTVIVPLHPVVQKILDKYEGKIPKTVQAQPFNRGLKTVCEKAGLTEIVERRVSIGDEVEVERRPLFEVISSHSGRRTFVTLASEKGAPIETIQAIVGHATITQTLSYLKTSERAHAVRLAGNTEWLKLGVQ